jgi:two-component system sensor histidine kinase SenX3
MNLRRFNNESVIEVIDHGIGIAAEEQARIFEKFYRVRSPETTVAGTGLGLTLALHIVKAHHGRLNVTSRPGEGSTFSIVLPMSS